MNDTEILAKTIYGEARGEFNKLEGGLASLIAVANVVMNRVKKGFFGNSIEKVCLKPWQFSCWNRNDSNYEVITKVDCGEKIFDICLEISKKIISGVFPDLTKNADHYYSSFLKVPPFWAKGKKPSVKIGNHLFFNIYGD
jgi:N-acetylmuramoyl-L-alanine amidase